MRLLIMLSLLVGLGWCAEQATVRALNAAGSRSGRSGVEATQAVPSPASMGKVVAELAPAPRPRTGSAFTPALTQGKGKGPMNAEVAADREVFHFLLEHHKKIKRTVKLLDQGVETVTESETPEVAKKIQEHVPAMYERMKNRRPIRHWDPLFTELFKHGDKIKMTVENTQNGVRVTEISEDLKLVKLIQAHADVVSKFVENGFSEAHKEHALPPEVKKQ